MQDVETLDALYNALENSRGDPVTLSALADWFEEHDDLPAAACLRAAVDMGRQPGYNNHQFMYGKFFWELCEASPIINEPPAQLPRPLWEALPGNDEPHPVYSFKSYRTARFAYQALIAAWKLVGPVKLLSSLSV